MRFLCILFLYNIILSLTIENIIVSDDQGNELDFIFIENNNNLELNKNYFWVETVKGGYDIKYSSQANIAGFQFNFSGFKNIENYNFLNGEIEKNNFMLTHAGYDDATFLAFSFDNKVLSKGEHILFEIRTHQFLDELNENNDTDDIISEKADHLIKDIDITNIVVSDNRGNSIDVDFICHKEECKDFRYNKSDNVNYNQGLVIFKLRTNGDNKWIMEYDSNIDIAGYQFNVEGAQIKSVFGGASAFYNFVIKGQGNTVLSFSFQGDVIPLGKGDLVEFEVQ